MSSDTDSKVKATAERIIELGKEVEAPGQAVTGDTSMQRARTVLGAWLDGMRGIVVNPALGRVTVIHENGDASSIASAELAFRLSAAGITQLG
ncbi:hypothetical protein [Solimonas terrae]|uniref:Uncharacterized protein n=1 Tax=Solimonas terrae TaxID=1396819 RepID=A0A6M2BUM5_9GAMM|nr:hypothetical protein [Solimonas terrae]NGY05689.1 hypothetical protein [Solimonas terrae]